MLRPRSRLFSLRLGSTALVAAGLSLGCSQGSEPARPNVLIILADDLASRTLESFGGSGGSMPRVDALARSGTTFRHAVASSPFCTPSRQSFLTGRWPHAIGVTQVQSVLPTGLPTLGSVFGQAGYRTAAIGKMHWNGPRVPERSYGFETVVELDQWLAQLDAEELAAARWHYDVPTLVQEKGWAELNFEGKPLRLPQARQSATYWVDRTIEFIDTEDERPFLAFCSFREPHPPFVFPESFATRFPPEEVELPAADLAELRRNVPGLYAQVRSWHKRDGKPSPQDLRGMTSSYLRSAAWLDSQVGRLLDHLEESGRSEDTLVVFWSDHGLFLGEHGLTGKNYAYREVIESPLILSGPGVPSGACDALVQALDVFPTLCELTRVPAPELLDGRSLGPLLRGEAEARAEAFCEFMGLWAALRTADYKLVLGTEPGTGWDQLYDLRTDPEERINRFGEAQLEGVVEELIERMRLIFAASPPLWMRPERWIQERRGSNAVRWAITRLEPSGWGSRDAGRPRDG